MSEWVGGGGGGEREERTDGLAGEQRSLIELPDCAPVCAYIHIVQLTGIIRSRYCMTVPVSVTITTVCNCILLQYAMNDTVCKHRHCS